MERDKDALLEYYVEMTPEALESLTPGERHWVYGILGLGATITMDGTLEVSGMFNNWDIRCGLETRYSTHFAAAKRPGVRFRALVDEGRREVVFELLAPIGQSHRGSRLS